MPHYLLNFPDWQKEAVRDLSQATGYSMAEVLRRLLENGLKEPFLWEVFPAVSGAVAVRSTR